MATLLESIDGKEYVLEDVSVERVLRLNNDNSITVKAPYTPHNLDIFHKMDKRWKFYLNDMGDNDYYIVDDITFNAVDNGTDLEFFAISKFNDDLRQDMIYEEHSGSKTALKWVEMIDKWSKYNVRLGVDGLSAISIESFGLFSVREGLEIICNKYDLEFYLNKSSNTIILTRTVGNILDDYVKYEVNLGDVTKSMNFTDFSTYGKGYGAFKDPDKPELGRYETEYTSPLASIYGKLPITPVSDERFSVLDNLKAEIKNRVDNSIVESIEIDVDDLYMFKHTNISVGDSLPMIDPRLDFHKDVRVFEIVEQWNEQNELTDIEYTLNNYSEAYRQMVSEGGMEHRLTTQFEESVSDMGHFVKDLEADISAEMEKMYNDLSGQFTQGLDGLTRIYRQPTAPSPIKDIPVNSLWYKPVKNPTGVQPEYDVEMYGMVEGVGGVKAWQLLSDRNSRDASRLNVGTLDAATINVINLNANSLTAGAISGKGSSWNLDTGVISFSKGKIQGSNCSWNLDTGVISFSKGSNSSWNMDLVNYGIKITNRYGMSTGLFTALLDTDTQEPKSLGVVAENGHDAVIGYRGNHSSTGNTFSTAVRVNGTTGLLSLQADMEISSDTIRTARPTIYPSWISNESFYINAVGGVGGVTIRNSNSTSAGLNLLNSGEVEVTGNMSRLIVKNIMPTTSSHTGINLTPGIVNNNEGIWLRNHTKSSGIFMARNGGLYVMVGGQVYDMRVVLQNSGFPNA